jgi:hypothetical protein
LNTNIYDIELAVQRGKASYFIDSTSQFIGVDLRLKRVADEVSCKSDSGGMLKQIKQFNAFLERAALALESRRG